MSLAGLCLDALGGLYLAYDLLGGRHGPLRLLTRMVTYSVVFGLGYGLGLGVLFGAAAGAASGVTVAIELRRASQDQPHYPLRWETVFSSIRGAAFGLALYPSVGLPFAVAFGLLVTIGQVMAYARGMRPGRDYSAARKPRLTPAHLWGSLVRTFGYIATALFCSLVFQSVDHPWRFAIRLGIVTGVVTTVGIGVSPFIEYYADNLPERRLGVFGIWLLFCGFLMQSFQYWVALLEIPVT